MRASLSHDALQHVAPLLSQPHLSALDRRLKTVLQTVSLCEERRKEDDEDQVIYDDIAHLKGEEPPAG
ncbi:hypothetical protein KUCAC02_027894 [Chaenocephalus aceratus]|nr:hypothetical protein KUCAC02_027894 [Chaenocephalus aceratus]